jgi:hypothetical protein
MGEATSIEGINMQTECDNSLNVILYVIFKQVFPVWLRFTGDVPDSELRRLDQRCDFPPGIAASAVKRLNCDIDLQKQCEQLFL